MRNKRLLRTLSVLCLTLVLVSGFTVPAFAQGAAPPPAEDTTNDSNVVEETEKAPPLTPDGNAALVDDFGGNKQLIRYEGLDWLRSIGQTVKRENYDLVYTAPLEPCKSPQVAVEQLYNQFNNDHPADYHHPSMSVSDIVAIRQDGKVSCH